MPHDHYLPDRMGYEPSTEATLRAMELKLRDVVQKLDKARAKLEARDRELIHLRMMVKISHPSPVKAEDVLKGWKRPAAMPLNTRRELVSIIQAGLDRAHTRALRMKGDPHA